MYKASHTFSSPSGKNPANVMFIFDRQYANSEPENNFIRELNFELKFDWYKTYAIKCFNTFIIKRDHLLKCREYLKQEIHDVNPYLVILFGKTAVLSVLGSTIRFRQNIFYIKNNKRFFIAESMKGNEFKIDRNLKTLLLYIRSYYS